MAYTATFRAFAEPGFGPKWTAHTRSRWPAYAGIEADGDTGAAVSVLERSMPELMPVYRDLVAALDGDPHAARLATGVDVPVPGLACSQTVVDGALLRNYDWHPEHADLTIISSDLVRPVLGVGEMIWGLLDGMNDAGLVASLTFGGRFVRGDGIAFPLVVRYLLETCDTVAQAVDRLRTLPIPTSQNLTLLGADGAVSVHVGPDRDLAVADAVPVTNHQEDLPPAAQEEFSATVARRCALQDLAAAHADVEAVAAAMFAPPLYSTGWADWLGTLYTAVYRPADGAVSYRWPAGQRWEQGFAAFDEGERTVSY
jgi:predicted choloylglycine hydrolase